MTAFPPHPPVSLTDRGAITANDWAAYSELGQLVDHWSRPAWPDGAEAYYWLLTLEDQPQLRDRAEECQKALQDDTDLTPVPLDLLHLTLLRAGAVDEVTTESLAALAVNAAERIVGTGAIPLIVGPLAGSSGAVRFSVAPWDRILDIHAELAAATNDTLGERPAKPLRPHISIAYNSSARDARPVIAAVQELRDAKPVKVSVAHVQLVALRRQGMRYSWTTHYTITLQSPEGPITSSAALSDPPPVHRTAQGSMVRWCAR